MKKPMTVDDFIELVVKPRAEAGEQFYITMMEVCRLAREGKMTPELAQELAKKAMP